MRAGEGEVDGRYSALSRLVNNQSMRRILLHPAYFLVVAAFFLVYGTVFGHFSVLVGLPCFSYLAWHFRRQATRQSHAARRGPPAVRIRRFIYVAGLVGIAAGGISGYWQFVQLRWTPLSALAMSAACIVFSGMVMWLVLRAVWGSNETAGA